MDADKFEKYLKERYYKQIEWYSRKAAINQKAYKKLQYSLIVLSALTPVLIILNEWADEIPWLVLIPALTSVAVAVLTSIIKTFGFQENWINYRTTREALGKEIYLFDAGIGDYAQVAGKQELFIERVESLIARENSLWLVTQKPSKQKKDDNRN